MNTHIRVRTSLLAAATFAAATAQAQDPLAARAASDRALLERVRNAPPSAATAMQDSVRLRLAALDSTYDMLVAVGRADDALAFASAMNPHWQRLTDYGATLARFQRALALQSPPRPARVAALRQAAFAAFRHGDLATANRLAGNYEAAARIYEYTIALYGISGSAAGAAVEMLNLGFVRLHQNDTITAARLFRESLTALRAMNSTDQVYLLGAFAALAAVQRQPRRAALLYGAMESAVERAKIVLDPDDQGEVDTYQRIARRQIGTPAFDSARTEGRSLSVDAAVILALSRY